MEPSQQRAHVRDSESTSGSSGPMTASELRTDETGDLDRTRIVRKAESPSPTRKATGPRTAAGKERSKRNSLKHGIFSNVALLKNESRSEFDSLLNGLRDDFEPEGMLEEILVEKLAVLIWRHHRLFLAEAAEIQNGAAFLEWDEKERQEKEAHETPHDSVLDLDAEVVGLMQRMENPQVLERCLKLLEELKNDIQTTGFNSESDEKILIKLYGDREHLTTTLLDTYRLWNETAKCSDQERKESGCASVAQCKRNVLITLDEEIGRLNHYKKAKASIESERARLGSLRKNVPDAPQLDRLLRYETNLERAFDRTLTQLERLQRTRKGQPVLPPIKVDVSS